MNHNHVTRDIKTAGKCDSCDIYHILEFMDGEFLNLGFKQAMSKKFSMSISRIERLLNYLIDTDKIRKLLVPHVDGSLFLLPDKVFVNLQITKEQLELEDENFYPIESSRVELVQAYQLKK